MTNGDARVPPDALRTSRSRTFRRCTSIVSGWILGVTASSAGGADWPNFRGPNHDGLSPERGFRKVWTEPIPLLWERRVGPAFSSFAIVAERVYTGGTQNGQQAVFCLEAGTGEVVWQRAYEPEYRESMGGDGPRATPTVDDGRVYMVGALGALLCLDARSGEIVWRHEFHHVPQWGYSGSVLIEGDLAIASGGKSDGALAAFDKRTGRQVWKAGEDPAGYATPYPFTFQQRRYIVGFSGSAALIVEAKTGREAARIPWKTDWEVNAAAPIVFEDHLFLTSGYDTGAGLFKLRSDQDRLGVDPVWQNRVFLAKFQSCILWDGRLYGSDQRALICADFLTGKEIWRKPRLENGTLVLADGHLLLLTEQGQLQIAPATPDGFEPQTRADILDGRCWAVPVLHQNRLFARNQDRVACFNLAPSGGGSSNPGVGSAPAGADKKPE